MSHLNISNVRLTYGDLAVLKDVNLQIGEGEMHILLGPSGCGKTTLLRTIAGLATQDSGKIELAGLNIGVLPPKGRNIGMVFQHYALFPNMTVRENLEFGLKHRKWEAPRIKAKVDQLLETVSLVDRANMRPHQLSGGQKQRVALARALALEPKLLLLDEPLSALDAQIRKRLRDELKRIQREFGLTSILVTHDQDEALSLGDRISVMDAGEIAQTATGPELFYRPANLFVARFVGDANIIDAADFSRITGRSFSQTVVIQPHGLKIAAGAQNGAIALSGKVLETGIAGSIVRYVVDIDGVRAKVEHQTANDSDYLQIGQPVTLCVQPKDIHLVTPN